ncbi:MAG: PAS domain S-box protein [Candidatus Izemoplasmatales bacterium]|jgi:diguanylate cyclase (GGDEF)-like protein/PAS domain S-box-containing protein|nr:PAS domain S-box protein [Candidatus Izemoplasmatales bacterium]
MENNIKKIRVLAIDDKMDNLITVTALISEMFSNIEIYTSLTGAQGLKLASELDPDVVLLDIVMPFMDGYEVCRKIKSDEKLKDIPVVFITALKGDKESRLKALESGGDAFLAKPIDEVELYAQIKAMAKIKQANLEIKHEKNYLKKLVDEQTEELRRSNLKTVRLLEAVKRENSIRKLTESALLEAQRISHIGSWEFDVASHIFLVSQETLNIYGIVQASLYISLEESRKSVLPEYHKLLDQSMNNLIQNQIDYDVQFKIKKIESGITIFVRSRAQAVYDDFGKVVKVIGTIQDITDIENARRQLETTKIRLENVITATNIGIWEWDIVSDKFYSNDRLANMLGYELSDYPTGKEKRFELIHPTDIATLNLHLKHIFSRKDSQYSIEYRMKHKNGNWIWIHDLGNVTKWSETGKPLVMSGTHLDITNRKQAEDLLIESEQRFRVLFEKAPFGYQSLDFDGNFIEVNQKWLSLFGYHRQEVIDHSITEFLVPEFKEKFMKNFELFKKQGHIYSELKMMTKSGKIILAGFDGTVGYDASNNFKQTHCTVRDITEINIANEKLKASEHKYHQLVDQMPLGMVMHEIICDDLGKPVDYIFLNFNKAFADQIGFTEEETIGKSVLEILPETESYWIDVYGKVALFGVPAVYENYSKSLNKYFKVLAYSTEYKKFAVIVEDITLEKQKMIEIEYLSNHDFLSGLYNRRFFVEEFKKYNQPEFYPLAIMMMDINGLKIINDAFGHNTGDEAIINVSKVLRSTFRETDIIARIGGDEFAIILPNTTAEEMEILKLQLAEKRSDLIVENVEISLATGYELNTMDHHEDLDEVLKFAENHMYRHKLTEGISVRNHAIKAILKTLTEKYDGERIHSSKVSYICRRIGEEIGLSMENLKELELAGMYHDIGKISLPDAILNKPSKLTKEEFDVIKTHPEISYQILRAADEYSDLAIHALHHHEKWDGSGYPSGLKGEEIPLFSRIISVADAFEAMTAVRPYKNRMSVKDALDEIIRCSGTQFDANIAKIFIEKVMVSEME